jgi:hypothetical protein
MVLLCQFRILGKAQSFWIIGSSQNKVAVGNKSPKLGLPEA